LLRNLDVRYLQIGLEIITCPLICRSVETANTIQ